MKKIGSLQELIEHLKPNILFAHKKGYRTLTLRGEELAEKIAKTRTFLKKEGLTKGDKLIILGMNSLEWIVVYFACIFSGIIVVPLDLLTNKVLLKKIQSQVKAKIIFQDIGLASLNIKRYYLEDLDQLIETSNEASKPDFKKISLKADDIIEIMYTSGTTGIPKGVILTHENIIAGINAAISSVPLKIKLKILNVLPLSHIFSQIYGLFLLIYFGHEIFFIDSIKSKKIISFIRNKNINSIVLVPGILDALKKELEGKSLILNLGVQFRLIGVGGAHLDTDLEKWWRRHLITVVQGYGLTETASVATVNSLLGKTGSAGKIAKDVELKLGEDNEILIRGKNVMSGYYKNEEKTKQSFEQGWFKTGDIGEIKNGHLYIKERKKDVIITGSGLKAYPIDIESILNIISPVKESCVLEKDKKIRAVVILHKKADLPGIIKKANEKLLSHQKITSYSLWPYPDFPKTPTGKIKKFFILEEINKAKPIVYSYENKLQNIIHNVLKPYQKINQDSKLSDLGMDSLKRVELVSELENEFGIEIDETKLDQRTKVAELQKLIQESSVHRIRFRKWPLNPVLKIIRYIFQRILIFPIIRIFTKTNYSGLDNIPNGPVIFASNHQSALDAPIIMKKINKVAVSADSYYVFGIGEKGLQGLYRRLRGFFSALFFNAYPFGESIGTDASLEFTGEMLDRGYSILIFPEAHRTLNGEMQEFKSGVGYLALNMKTQVVPVKIEGLFQVLPAGKIIPRFHKSSIKFGKPIKLEGSYLDATKIIGEKVKEL